MNDDNSYAQIVARAAASKLKLDGGMPSLHRWCPYAPTEKQAYLLDQDFPQALYGGAVGGGKTGLLLMSAFKYVDIPQYRALILRCSYPALTEPQGILDQAQTWLAGTGARWYEKDKRFVFPSGAIVQLGYLSHDKDLQRYIGGGYHGIFFDQLEQFLQRWFVFLFSRVRKLKHVQIPLRCYATANPSPESMWIYDYFVDPTDAIFDGIGYTKTHINDENKITQSVFVPAVLTDNPGIDVDSYLDQLANLDPVTRQMLLKGDWLARPDGDIYKMRPPYHVVTRSEFKKVFKTAHIPEDWNLSLGLDWGATKEHPTALCWTATAPQYAAVPGLIVIYREKVIVHPTEDDVANFVINAESYYSEAARILYRMMSHEALTERHVLATKYKLHFTGALPQATAGIGIVRYYLGLHRLEDQNPFRSVLRGWPRMILLVEDGQGEMIDADPSKLITDDSRWHVKPAINEFGLKQHRLEFFAYKWEGVKPRPFFNDMMDALRNNAFKFPIPKGLTLFEKNDKTLPEAIQLANISMVEDIALQKSLSIRRSMELIIQERIRQRTSVKTPKAIWNRNFQLKG